MSFTAGGVALATVSMNGGVHVACVLPSTVCTSRSWCDPREESPDCCTECSASSVSGSGAVPESVSPNPIGKNTRKYVDVNAAVYIASSPVFFVFHDYTNINTGDDGVVDGIESPQPEGILIVPNRAQTMTRVYFYEYAS